MSSGTFRIRMKHSWTGAQRVGEEKRHIKAGEVVDVDTQTFQALVFQHGIAEAVSVEEIEAKAKEEAKATRPAKRKTTASKTKARSTPAKDKMQKSPPKAKRGGNEQPVA